MTTLQRKDLCNNCIKKDSCKIKQKILFVYDAIFSTNIAYKDGEYITAADEEDVHVLVSCLRYKTVPMLLRTDGE